MCQHDVVVLKKADDSHEAEVTAVENNKVNPDELWYLHGKAYDLSSYVHSHPGGREALLSSQGRDITILFESYHTVCSDRPWKMLATFKEVKVPESVLAERCDDRSRYDFFRLPDGTPEPLWQAIKTRCRDYLRDNNISRTMGWGMFTSWLLTLCAHVCIYYYGFLSPHMGVSCASGVLMALTAWHGSRVAHDGLHYALSKNPYFSLLCGSVGALFVYNPVHWQQMHNILHHGYTNEEHVDPDLHHGMIFARSHPNYKWSKYFALQKRRYYTFIRFTMGNFVLTVFEPLLMLITGSGALRNAPAQVKLGKADRPLFYVLLAAHWLAWQALMLGIPFYANTHADGYDGDWLKTLGVRLLALWSFSSVEGLFFGFMTQVSHLTEICVLAGTKDTSWAQRQVETTINWGVQSLFWNVMSAGNNCQIEHHLFPTVAQDKLPHLAPIVKAACDEFGAAYLEHTYPTLLHMFYDYHAKLSKRSMNLDVLQASHSKDD